MVGFICHLIVEKTLKAVITENINEFPPKIHDLKSLAKHGNLLNILSNEQLDLLEQLNPLQIKARYPEYKNKISEALTLMKCHKIYTDTEEFLCWTKHRLNKLPKDMQK